MAYEVFDPRKPKPTTTEHNHPTCAVHGTELVCLKCRNAIIGAMGGKSRSDAKVASARKTILNTKTHKIAKRRSRKKTEKA